jgi:nucleotide-binding universal stress UspA family protein
MTTRPSTIIAVTSKKTRHVPVLDRAAALGKESGATVILFDLDADLGPFESPLPTDWSGDGEKQQFGSRLDPSDLDAAGQAALADRVRIVRAAGVEAFGWLPPKADAWSLVEYAAEQSADLVLVSTEDTELIQALRASPEASTPEASAGEQDRPDPSAAHVRVEAVTPRG